MTGEPSTRHRRAIDHLRDDTGGVWINTGIVLGVIFYLFILTMLVAGFGAVLPLVVLPPVVLGLIAANNLLGGGRSYGKSSSRAPVATGEAAVSGSVAVPGTRPAEEPLPPR